MQKNAKERTKKRMPTWLKRLLVVFGIVILLGGSFVIYLLKFKEYDIADSEVTEITRETYNIKLPDGSTIELDENGNIVESDTSGNSVSNSLTVDGTESTTETSANANDENNSSDGSSSGSEGTSNTSENDSTSGNGSTTGSTGGGTSENGGSSGSNGSGTSGNGDSTGNTGGTSDNGGSTDGNGGSSTSPSNENRVTVASIKDKYDPVMSSLQGQASSRIDALVGRAYSEYQAKKANDESVDYGYFYNKYTSAAAELEARTDKVFYQIVGVIESELEANNLAASHAQSFITQYEKEKEARRSALLDKAINR